MRILTSLTCLLLSVLLTSAAMAAEDEAPKKDRATRRSEMRQKMLEKFDADGDGELNEEERNIARESMRNMRAKQGDGEKGRRGRGGRGRGQGQAGRRGPGGPQDPGKLFDKYDADGDGQLTREEFMELSKAMRQMRPGGRGRGQGRGRGPGPGARDGKGPGGPPADGPRRDAKRKGPKGDSEGRPGPPPEGRGRGGRRGPDAQGGPEGRPQFSPGAMFDRLDTDSDGLLSRDEYLKFANRFRNSAGRGQRGGERGARDGRGGRRGPPGAEGGRRGPRKPRPDFEGPDAGADDKAKVDDTV